MTTQEAYTDEPTTELSYNTFTDDYHTYNPDDRIKYAKKVMAAWTTAYFHLYSLITLVSQSLTIMAVFRFRKLQTPANAFIVSLAVADLIQVVPLITLPYVQSFQSDFAVHSVGSLSVFLHVWSTTESLMTLTFIAVDRYRAVKHPLEHKASITMSNVIKQISISWLLGSCVPLMILGYTIQKGPLFLRKTLAVSAMVPFQPFIILCVVPVVVLMTLCCVLYTRALCEIHGRKRRIADLHSYMVDARLRKLERENSRSTKMMAIIMASLVLTWVPYNIFTIATTPNMMNNSIPLMVAFRLILMFVYANSFNNAFIFAWANPDFRNAYIKILKFQ